MVTGPKITFKRKKRTPGDPPVDEENKEALTYHTEKVVRPPRKQFDRKKKLKMAMINRGRVV